MPKYYIWRHEAATDYAIIEAEDNEAALALVEDGDDALTWINQRYNAEYDVEPFDA